ncbi:MAG: cytochrome c3 family protein [Candidatus Wallbacteria bacterium]|nr:cytochrome c3 family protein [Candidatus Wallbacteria bacterium]
MRTPVMAAALMAAFVLGGYSMLILAGRFPSAGREGALDPSAPARVKFVPPLEWIEQRSHARTASATGAAQVRRVVFHEKVTSPKVRVFQTGYKGGTQIVFDHEKHVRDLGLECIDCHHVERCSKCHFRDGENTMSVTRSKQALHESCLACHASSGGPQKCDECHKQ